MSRFFPRGLRTAWIASILAITLAVTSTAWVILATWRTIGAVEIALPQAGFDALRELNIMIRDVTVLENAVRMAIMAPEHPDSAAQLQVALDFAYIRFVRQDFSEFYPHFPGLPEVMADVRVLIDSADVLMAAGQPYDPAALESILAGLRRAAQEISRFYYTFGENTSAVLAKQQNVLAELKVDIVAFLALLGVLGVASALLLVNRMSALRKIRYLSNHDVLTRLPNRTWFVDNARRMVRATAPGQVLGLFIVDLDRFKEVNDTFGHPVGDLLLQEAAQRLKRATRGRDVVVRLAGDEFAILAPDLGGRAAAAAVAARIVSEFSGTALLGGHHLPLSCSVGGALYPGDGNGLDQLLAHADMALYAAKRAGRGGFRLFTAGLADELTVRTTMESAIARALRQGEFSLVWQPQLDLRSGQMSGVEVLLRWFDPERSAWIPPSDFVPVAEAGQLINELDRFVLRAACLESEAIQARLGRPLRVSVNVSARSFEQEGFPETVRAILEETGCPGSLLELEITEGILIRNQAASAENIRQLARLGVRVAIDDFGTGYSGLSYFAELQVERLKIDQSFLKGVGESERKRAIVEAIIRFARALGIETVAEGVETAEQLEALARAGCDAAQGYFIAPPLTAAELEAWWRERSARPAARQRLRVVAHSAPAAGLGAG